MYIARCRASWWAGTVRRKDQAIVFVYDSAMHGASQTALRDGTKNRRSVADRLRCLLLACYAGIEIGECLDE